MVVYDGLWWLMVDGDPISDSLWSMVYVWFVVVYIGISWFVVVDGDPKCGSLL